MRKTDAFSPVSILSGHTRGIWSVSWCPFDNDLLLSCGRDNRTLCWNVKTAEVISEVRAKKQSLVLFFFFVSNLVPFFLFFKYKCVTDRGE